MGMVNRDHGTGPVHQDVIPQLQELDGADANRFGSEHNHASLQLWRLTLRKFNTGSPFLPEVKHRGGGAQIGSVCQRKPLARRANFGNMHR